MADEDENKPEGGDPSGGGDGDKGKGPVTVTMSQEDFEARMTAKVAQAQRAWERDLADKLGGKVDEVATELTGLRTKAKEGMDDAERAKTEAQEALAKLQAKEDSLTAREAEMQVREALLIKDGDRPAANPDAVEDAITLVATRMAADDKLDLTKAIAAVHQSHPSMFGQSSGSNGTGSRSTRAAGAGPDRSSGEVDPVKAGAELAKSVLNKRGIGSRPLDRKPSDNLT